MGQCQIELHIVLPILDTQPSVYLTAICKNMKEALNNIHWHDCEIESVIEMPNKDTLVINVQYPENWENNEFAQKGIIFEGYHSQEVNEMPFEGNPTILDASIESEENEFTTINLETNAGYRLVTAKSVTVGNQVGNI